jgi:nucleoside phosphorylase
MESVVVAIVCYQNKIPFIAFRGLSNLAGGGSSVAEVYIFLEIASENAVDIVVKFISLL